ncbi:nucleotidyltransferase family protein [Candidatus Woesearchaeota archaeon]|nr:nucleotidyltransferase family protein [Candidatus Woesearchaeota archaeon]
MKAIILAAGYATRMSILTQEMPKPLLPIRGKRLIEHILGSLITFGKVDEVIIVTNKKFHGQFVLWEYNYEKLTRPPFRITLLNDGSTAPENRRGAVGDVAFSVEQARIAEDTLIIAGDNLFSFSLSSFYRFFLEKKASSVALYDVKDKTKIAHKLGAAVIDAGHRITGFEEKPAHPSTTLAATACYIFQKEDLHFFQEYVHIHPKPDNLGDIIHWLLGKTSVFGFIFDEEWHDVGTVEQYTFLNAKK